MANIRKLTSKKLKGLSLTNNFLYLQNTATGVETKLSLSELVGKGAVSVGTGLSIYKGITNTTLNFRTVIGTSPVVPITISSDTDSINVGFNSANLDLALCDNTSSLFLSTVDLTTNVGATILPVANGGTGAATLTDGGILLGSGTGAITAMAALAAGTIIQGDGTTDPTTLALGTAGQVLTVNGGATAAEWTSAGAADNLGNHTATTTLDLANNNIDLGSGSINNTGASSLGLSFDSNHRAHIIPTGTTISTGTKALNISGGLHFKGDIATIMSVGSPASGVGSDFFITGSDAGTSSSDGGKIVLQPGRTTSGTGGDTYIYAGRSTSGSAGDITLFSMASDTAIPILRVTPNKRISIQNGEAEIAPTSLLDIRQTEAAGAVTTMRVQQDDQDHPFIHFEGTSAADSTKNISTSTAVASAKNGAIKIRFNVGGEVVDGWIRTWETAV